MMAAAAGPQVFRVTGTPSTKCLDQPLLTTTAQHFSQLQHIDLLINLIMDLYLIVSPPFGNHWPATLGSLVTYTQPGFKPGTGLHTTTLGYGT